MENLPPEKLEQIFLNLKLEDLELTSQTSKLYHDIITNPIFREKYFKNLEEWEKENIMEYPENYHLFPADLKYLLNTFPFSEFHFNSLINLIMKMDDPELIKIFLDKTNTDALVEYLNIDLGEDPDLFDEEEISLGIRYHFIILALENNAVNIYKYLEDPDNNMVDAPWEHLKDFTNTQKLLNMYGEISVDVFLLSVFKSIVRSMIKQENLNEEFLSMMMSKLDNNQKEELILEYIHYIYKLKTQCLTRG